MAGRPAAPIHISNNILHCSALANFDCTSKVLYEHVSDCMQWLLWLAEHWLVHSSNVCSNCGGQMSLTRRLESSDSPDIQGGPKQVSPYWSVGGLLFWPTLYMEMPCYSVKCSHWIFFRTLWPQYRENSDDGVLLGVWGERCSCQLTSCSRKLTAGIWYTYKLQ